MEQSARWSSPRLEFHVAIRNTMRGCTRSCGDARMAWCLARGWQGALRRCWWGVSRARLRLRALYDVALLNSIHYDACIVQSSCRALFMRAAIYSSLSIYKRRSSFLNNSINLTLKQDRLNQRAALRAGRQHSQCTCTYSCMLAAHEDSRCHRLAMLLYELVGP